VDGVMTSVNTMGDFVGEARRILNEMEATHKLHEKQLDMYKDVMDTAIQFNKERIDASEKRQDTFEKRWGNMRSILIGFMGLFLVAFIGDRIELNARPTTTKIEDEYTKKSDVLQGFGSVIDDTYNTFETLQLITHEESYQLRLEAKKSVLEEIDPDRAARSATVIK